MTRGGLLVVAGEASGDLLGARLLDALRAHGTPLQAFGLGGERLAAAGVELVARAEEISVVGITEALKILPRARVIFRRLLDEVDRRRPDVAVLIDFPEFNLRLAEQLHRRGVPVCYYISPQIWAWRRRRVHTIARVVDRMLVLFPFELEFYRRHHVPAVHVGHPLVDEVPTLPQAWDRDDRGERRRLALLPGSRRSEITALLPTMLAAAREIAARVPLDVQLILAPGLARDGIEQQVGAAGVPIEIVDTNRFAAIADSHLALCASGTATLEVGLLGTPMIVVYRLARWTYWLARLLVRVPHFALVNLVLGERAVPELIQDEASPQRIAEDGLALLGSPELARAARQRLAPLRQRLGQPGASERAAAEVARFLRTEVAA